MASELRLRGRLAIKTGRTCKGCSRPLFGPGARCSPCQAVVRANRQADRIVSSKPRRAKPSPRCPEHLAWIRTLPCTVRGCLTGEAIHAHHVRNGTGAGTGLKPGDEWTVPICPQHHREIHQAGRKTFEDRYQVDLRETAIRLAAASPWLPEPNEKTDRTAA